MTKQLQSQQQQEMFGGALVMAASDAVFELKKNGKKITWNGKGRIPKWCLENTITHIPTGKPIHPNKMHQPNSDNGLSNYGWWRNA